MQRRAVGVALLFLLVTSFHGLASQGGYARAYELAGAPGVPPPSIKAPATSFLSHWTPVELLIPRISVDASVEARGLDNSRNLDTPRDFRDVAWYNQGPAPGKPGNALINGHVNWWTGSAVFGRLSQLRPGDEVFVVREDGSQLAFKVTSRTIVAAGARIPSLFAPSQAATLTLITCTGVWDKARGTDTQRLLVSAALE
jgi:LPXTG-site transpeptidase (sortase) family protein